MDITKLDMYIEGYELVLTESADMKKTISDLDKNLKELKKQKNISADIMMDFKDLSKRIEALLKKPVQGKVDEKMMSFGDTGRLEVFGENITISKAGKSITMTKKELADIVIKAGIAKRKMK